MEKIFIFKTEDIQKNNSEVLKYSFIKNTNYHHKEINDYLTLLALINIKLQHAIKFEDEYSEERLIVINTNIKKTNDFTEKILINFHIEIDQEIEEWLKYEKRYLERTNYKTISSSYEAMIKSKNLIRSISEFLHLSTKIKFNIPSQTNTPINIDNHQVIVNDFYTFTFEKVKNKKIQEYNELIIKNKNYGIDLTHIKRSSLNGSTNQ